METAVTCLSRPWCDQLQQLAQFIATDAGGSQNGTEGAGLEIAVMQGNGQGPVLLGVDENVVRATDSIEAPALFLEGPDELSWRDRR